MIVMVFTYITRISSEITLANTDDARSFRMGVQFDWGYEGRDFFLNLR